MDTARSLHLERKPRCRGAIVALLAAGMTTLLLSAYLAVDVGYACALTGEAQDTADAASLAGASALKDGAYHQWYNRAMGMVTRSQKLQGFSAPDAPKLVLGRWDKGTQTFSALPAGETPNKANAVEVIARRQNDKLFFAPAASVRSTEIQRVAVAAVSPDCGGIWGITEVSVPGSVLVDSYDSRAGAYSTDSGGDNGDVCSNGPITVAGSAEINGDTLGEPVEVVGGSAVVTGNIDTLETPIERPAIDFGDVATTNDNGRIGLTDNGFDPVSSGDLFIRPNDNLTLAQGTYYFESIDFGQPAPGEVHGSLTVTDPTTIYINGDFGATATGVINTSTDPHNFTLILSGAKFKLKGNATFYGSIIAPNAEVKLSGTAEMFGALIADTIKFGGDFRFHVDESLPAVHTLKGNPVLVQ